MGPGGVLISKKGLASGAISKEGLEALFRFAQRQPRQPQPAQPRSAIPPADAEDPKQMSVRALKAELHSLGADWKHCVEKSELVELLVASRAAWPVSKQVSPAFEFGTTDGRATVAAVREA